MGFVITQELAEKTKLTADYYLRFKDEFKAEQEHAFRLYCDACVAYAHDNYLVAKQGFFKTYSKLRTTHARILVIEELLILLVLSPSCFNSYDRKQMLKLIELYIKATDKREDDKGRDRKRLVGSAMLLCGNIAGARKQIGKLDNTVESVLIHIQVRAAAVTEYREAFHSDVEMDQALNILGYPIYERLIVAHHYRFYLEVARFYLTNGRHEDAYRISVLLQSRILEALSMPKKTEKDRDQAGDYIVALLECSHVDVQHYLHKGEFQNAYLQYRLFEIFFECSGEEALSDKLYMCEIEVYAYDPKVKRKTLELLYDTLKMKHKTLVGEQRTKNYAELKSILGKLIREFKCPRDDEYEALCDEETTEEVAKPSLDSGTMVRMQLAQPTSPRGDFGTPAFDPTRYANPSCANCYAYALNDLRDRNVETWRPMPGYTTGREASSSAELDEIIALIKQDCAGAITLVHKIHWPPGALSSHSVDRDSFDSHGEVDISLPEVPEGSYLIALLIAQHHRKWDTFDTDIHFYRQDADGGWSHKRGGDPVERLPAKSGMWYGAVTDDLHYVKHGQDARDPNYVMGKYIDYRIRAYLELEEMA